jgi:hypothetical protein
MGHTPPGPGTMRRLAWLGIVAAGVWAAVYDSDAARTACALAILTLVAVSAPLALRPVCIAMGLVALVLAAACGASALLDALPATIAAFVAYLFARTLLRPRVTLIGRAIIALDGAERLADPAIARYARRLTLVWALYQSALAAVGAILALHTRGWFAGLPAHTPSPLLFGTFLLPCAVAILFLGEFVLRPYWLPQAPRRGLIEFVHGLVRTWPQLLDDGVAASAGNDGGAG